MNYYFRKSCKQLKYIFIDNSKIMTDMHLLKSIIAIETSHRNLLWRIAEYILFVLLPRRLTDKQLLTIGKNQMKPSYLSRFDKLNAIKMANNPYYLDEVINGHSVIANSKIDYIKLGSFIREYNGDKTGKYIECIRTLIEYQTNEEKICPTTAST